MSIGTIRLSTVNVDHSRNNTLCCLKIVYEKTNNIIRDSTEVYRTHNLSANNC